MYQQFFVYIKEILVFVLLYLVIIMVDPKHRNEIEKMNTYTISKFVIMYVLVCFVAYNTNEYVFNSILAYSGLFIGSKIWRLLA